MKNQQLFLLILIVSATLLTFLGLILLSLGITFNYGDIQNTGAGMIIVSIILALLMYGWSMYLDLTR